MSSARATVRVKTPSGQWTPLGSDYAPGVVPQGLTCSADEKGPLDCSFSLRRSARLPWDDLQVLAELEVEVPGCGLVWSGRIQQVAPSGPDEIGVSARGWQFYLDDDVMQRLWVHHDLSAWQDVRTFPTAANLTEFAGGQLSPSGGSALAWGLAGGDPLRQAANGGRAGFFFDGGYAGAIARVAIDWASANNSGSVQTYMLESDTDPSSITTFTSIVTWAGGASGTFTRTLATPRRYVSVIANNNTAADYTPIGGTWFRVTGARLFRSAAYESGGVSILKAHDVIKDVRATLLSAISTDESLISTTATTSIPQLTTAQLGGGYATPRQIFDAVDAFHDWLGPGIDADKRLFWQPRPTVAVAEVGAYSGSAFQDAGDSAEELQNRVLVTGTGPDGNPLLVSRTATSPQLTRVGYTRSRILSLSTPMTTAAAQFIGDAWLSTRAARPARGSFQLVGSGGARTADTGRDMHPAEFLRLTGQIVRLAEQWDPDTGGWGRDGTMVLVSYDDEAQTAALSIDAPNDRLDVVLGRLAAVRAAGIPLT